MTRYEVRLASGQVYFVDEPDESFDDSAGIGHHAAATAASDHEEARGWQHSGISVGVRQDEQTAMPHAPPRPCRDTDHADGDVLTQSMHCSGNMNNRLADAIAMSSMHVEANTSSQRPDNKSKRPFLDAIYISDDEDAADTCTMNAASAKKARVDTEPDTRNATDTRILEASMFRSSHSSRNNSNSEIQVVSVRPGRSSDQRSGQGLGDGDGDIQIVKVVNNGGKRVNQRPSNVDGDGSDIQIGAIINMGSATVVNDKRPAPPSAVARGGRAPGPKATGSALNIMATPQQQTSHAAQLPSRPAPAGGQTGQTQSKQRPADDAHTHSFHQQRQQDTADLTNQSLLEMIRSTRTNVDHDAQASFAKLNCPSLTYDRDWPERISEEKAAARVATCEWSQGRDAAAMYLYSLIMSLSNRHDLHLSCENVFTIMSALACFTSVDGIGSKLRRKFTDAGLISGTPRGGVLHHASDIADYHKRTEPAGDMLMQLNKCQGALYVIQYMMNAKARSRETPSTFAPAMNDAQGVNLANSGSSRRMQHSQHAANTPVHTDRRPPQPGVDSDPTHHPSLKEYDENATGWTFHSAGTPSLMYELIGSVRMSGALEFNTEQATGVLAVLEKMCAVMGLVYDVPDMKPFKGSRKRCHLDSGSHCHARHAEDNKFMLTAGSTVCANSFKSASGKFELMAKFGCPACSRAAWAESYGLL